MTRLSACVECSTVVGHPGELSARMIANHTGGTAVRPREPRWNYFGDAKVAALIRFSRPGMRIAAHLRARDGGLFGVHLYCDLVPPAAEPSFGWGFIERLSEGSILSADITNR